MTLLYILGAALLIMCASLVGVLSINQTFGHKMDNVLPNLISFAAGVFLFTSGFLIIESFHIFEQWSVVGGLVLAGFLASVILMRVLPSFHHHHDDACPGHSNAGQRILVGDAIHNIVDGLILVPAFMVSPWLGLGTLISIFFHELVQELSEFAVLRQSGLSVAKALTYNFLVSSTILIGIGLGFVIADTSLIQGVLLALSAGFMLQIVFSDLLPRHQHVSTKTTSIHLLLIVLGITIIGLMNIIFSH